MKAPISWLNDYTDIDIGSKKFADAMTLSGSKVEAVEIQGQEITNVVVGKILSIEKHPDAEKLVVTQVDLGDEMVQIVTGAKNINVGDYIPIAKHGSTLPGDVKIKKGKLRGIESNGMMCSIEELGLTKEDYPWADVDGIMILQQEYKLGTDIKEILGLTESVIEFEITPNRPDCLSVVGLGREAAVTLSKEFKNVATWEGLNENIVDSLEGLTVEIKAPELCPRYCARIIKDIKIGPSPDWMKKRLSACGVRSINNIVDVTNYVMLEMGQPLHAFDGTKLEGNKIVVRAAAPGEKITTLDEKEHELTSNMLVICDSSKPVAVAGVMGGQNSEIDTNTKTMVLESANFNGNSIRLTSKALGFRTEASSRFEKGLDNENTIKAVNRAAYLIEKIGAGRVVGGIIDKYQKKQETKVLKLDADYINRFLGTNIEKSYMVDTLKKLEFEVNSNTNEVIVPSFRGDVEGIADIAEEVVRFYGYNNIPSTLFAGQTTVGKKTKKQEAIDNIQNVLMAQGLSEVMTYSFVSEKIFDKINLSDDSKLRDAVEIVNPLTEDHKIMRTSIIPSMLDVLSTNNSRKIEEVSLFEISPIYIKTAEQLPEEKLVLTVGMYGNADFYRLKGILEEILLSFKIRNYSFEVEEKNPTFHPGRCATLEVANRVLGTLGEIHPDVKQNYGIEKRVYIAQIELLPIIELGNDNISYKALPRYPAVERDLAMVIKNEIMVGEIESLIKSKAKNILEEIKLFDVYKGTQIEKGYKSVAYSLKFRAQDKTLTDDEINPVMNAILEGLEKSLGAQLRK